MKTACIPVTEEEIRNVLTASPEERIEKQKGLLTQLGISPSNSTPYLDYVHHLQKCNGLPQTNDIQPELYMAIESDPRAKRFLMVIG